MQIKPKQQSALSQGMDASRVKYVRLGRSDSDVPVSSTIHYARDVSLNVEAWARLRKKERDEILIEKMISGNRSRDANGWGAMS
eukprot:scaffold103088_cov23-Cyclotella_meneghiniana.AAC.1